MAGLSQEVLKVRQSNYYHTQIVRGSSIHSCLHNPLCASLAQLMYGCLATQLNIAALVPEEGDHLLSGHPVIYAIAADDYEIVLIVLNLKRGDVGDCNHYMRVPSILFELRMRVAEGPRH